MVAARTTFVEVQGVAGDTFQIANGESIMVYGIFISNGIGSNREVEFRTADGSNNTIIYIESDKSSFFKLTTPFLADKGLEIVQIATVGATILDVTVFHSNPGA